ncbi:MAG: hypothetical protein D5R99_00340 [Methanocalculus sp. MSAO_Arc1]|nr:MAG: hypothetical protein D5R99_00340 [Methanocalculus sp. MSAO_Arc1]
MLSEGGACFSDPLPIFNQELEGQGSCHELQEKVILCRLGLTDPVCRMLLMQEMMDEIGLDV